MPLPQRIRSSSSTIALAKIANPLGNSSSRSKTVKFSRPQNIKSNRHSVRWLVPVIVFASILIVGISIYSGTPINQEVYDPNYHFPPSYVDDRRLPLTVLPEKERDARQADKIKALEDQMRNEKEKKTKEAAGEEIIDVKEYFKQPKRRLQ